MTRLPKYRLHRPSGQALVELGGKRHYLGKHGTAESRAKFDRIVGEWLAKGRQGAVAEPSSKGRSFDLDLHELIAAYWGHADQYYRTDGEVTGQHHQVRNTLKRLRAMYGDTLVTDFGPLAMAAFQVMLLETGDLSRTSINKALGIVRRMFKWGVGRELVSEAGWLRLRTVDGLKRGRTTAREAADIRPVDDHNVQLAVAALSETVADMVLVQRLLAARPSEICRMRVEEIDRSGDVWLYRPGRHKGSHLGRHRVLGIGPKAQELLSPRMLGAGSGHVFLNRSGLPYDKDSYAKRIRVACRRAGIEAWAPNRLRHSQATAIRAAFGLEGAQVSLGHSKADVTQLYAERDMRLLLEIARKLG